MYAPNIHVIANDKYCLGTLKSNKYGLSITAIFIELIDGGSHLFLYNSLVYTKLFLYACRQQVQEYNTLEVTSLYKCAMSMSSGIISFPCYFSSLLQEITSCINLDVELNVIG